MRVSNFLVILKLTCVIFIIGMVVSIIRNYSNKQDNEARLYDQIRQYKNKINVLEHALKQKNASPVGVTTLFERGIPLSRTLDREFKTNPSSKDFFMKSVTVMIHSDFDTSTCLISQITGIRQIFPTIKILVTSASTVSLSTDIAKDVKIVGSKLRQGKAFNAMLSIVDTKYFLYLSDGAIVSPFVSDNGPGWLLHALESIPELDFVGGAYLLYNSTLRFKQFEIQCYRLRMCHWVFSQSYEYKYSVGDMMVCEETSTSFMGRTASVTKVGHFDPDLDVMATTEFFHRAKNLANVGLRPEVFFTVTKTCQKRPVKPAERSLQTQPFMDKYELREIRDSYGRVTKYPVKPVVSPNTVLKFNYRKDGGVMTPKAYESMVKLLFMADDFFRSLPNVTYFLDAGVPLGSIKMRSILPWDGAGDIDTGYYGMKWQVLEKKLHALCKECSFAKGGTGFGPPGLMHVDISLPDGEGTFNEMYTHEFEPAPPPEEMIYIFVNGRDIPVHREFLSEERHYYGLDYLQTLHKDKSPIKCTKPSHHACVPDEFAAGAGHWSDFYCDK